MSRKLLAFLLSELTVVRFICKQCGCVAEIPADKIAERLGGASVSCPVCRREIAIGRPVTSGTSNPFANLADALSKFKELSPHFDVEFITPEPPAEAK